MAPTVGLVMIVKDEERTLPRLARSVREQVDHWTIVDTGSTDRTRQVAASLFQGLPGHVVDERWRGFGLSRNAALEAARPQTDWLLCLDADETLEGSIDRALLDGELDSIEAQQRTTGLSFWMPYLLRSGAAWEWRGRTHEYLQLEGREARTAQTHAFEVFHHADGGSRSDKFVRDVALLEADLDDEPGNARSTFYLARTYEDMGEQALAVSWYAKRIQLGGWDEERWYARWRLGVLLLATGEKEAGCGTLFDTWGERPHRAEPLCSLAEHYRQTEQWRLAWECCEMARRHTGIAPHGRGPSPETDRLFVHADVYQWRVAYEQSICAYYVGERAVGRSLCATLLDLPLPAEIRAAVEQNAVYYRS